MRQVKTNSYRYENLNEIDELLKCPICSNPLKEPVIHIHCGNTFCNKCIEGKTVCPFCNSSNLTVCKVPRNITFLLDNLKVSKLENELIIEQKTIELENKFNEMCQNLENKYNELFNELKKEREEFEIHKNGLLDYLTKSKSCNSNDIVKFNIGGQPFCFLKETICSKIKNPNYETDESIKDEYYEPTLLERLISSNIPVTLIDNDYIFIDRNPKLFHYIANYLRYFGSIDKYINIELPKEEEDLMRLKIEADFFGIQGLIDLIERNIIINEKNFFLNSKIINDNYEYLKLLNKWIGGMHENQQWQLIYRGSRDGFKAEDFHKLCDGKSHTITIIKSTSGHIFGGFTTSAWNQNYQYYSSPNSFLFSLNNSTKQDSKPMRFDLKDENDDCAIYCYSGYGPTFGGGHDLYISNNCNCNNNSSSNLGNTYGINVSYKDLTGNCSFTVEEIEVFTKI